MPSKTFKVDEQTTNDTPESANGESTGWEAPQAGTVKPCIRHSYKGGDTCVRCGASKSAASNRTTTAVSGLTRTRSARSGALEMPLSIAWMLMGYGIERQPFVLADPIPGRDGGPPTAPVSVVVGRTFKMEAAVAGKRIDKALRTTPLTAPLYKVVAPWFDLAGSAMEVGALFAPPLLVGLAALRPEVAQDPLIKSIMVGTLIPILAEQAKMAEQQAELLQKLEGVNAETIEQANRIVDALLGVDPK